MLVGNSLEDITYPHRPLIFELTCGANERNLYLSNAYLTNASFSPGFIVHLQFETLENHIPLKYA